MSYSSRKTIGAIVWTLRSSSTEVIPRPNSYSHGLSHLCITRAASRQLVNPKTLRCQKWRPSYLRSLLFQRHETVDKHEPADMQPPAVKRQSQRTPRPTTTAATPLRHAAEVSGGVSLTSHHTITTATTSATPRSRQTTAATTSTTPGIARRGHREPRTDREMEERVSASPETDKNDRGRRRR